jgi:phosphatidylserine/phosphatidylglycerophosphate/cardiolipin synthase-like enzyme
MKRWIISAVVVILFFHAFGQIPIKEARSKALESTVTVSGIVLNGPEMGVIRYIQDATAGIAVYSSELSAVKRGDSIVVTGALKDYNSLLEIDPVSNIQIISSNHNLPEPQQIKITDLSEEFEAELIQFKEVEFQNGGSTFTGNTSYNFTQNGGSSSIYVKAGSPLENQIIPTGLVKLTGICSQYSYSDPSSGYQLLLRDMEDIQNNSSIFFTSPIHMSNLGKNGFTLSWETNTLGTTLLAIGNTPSLEKDTLSIEGNFINHSMEISGASPSELFYVQAISTDGNDTAYSPVYVFVTQSESSGEIKVYFNTEIEDTAALETVAVYLDKTVDDTLIQYINRAKESIDLAIYNINNMGLSNITEALNSAYNRGVQVRIVHDGSTACLGLDILDSSIPTLASPTDDEYGIMHNKFMVIDAFSSDHNIPVVWTGSTNFTNDNMNEDANNVVIIQDKSMAIAYTLEFEEMWGSSNEIPDAEKALFGFDKKDNTPHEFIVGNAPVELYFSPSDQTNKYIIESIESANTDLSIATMLITRSDLAYAIRDANQRNVATNVITDNESSNSAFVNETLREELKVHYTFDNITASILHSKYMIVDQGDADSDPLVLTGSHNWSNSANNKNDENTLIIHNQDIANQFYQQFVYRFIENEGSFIELTEAPVANSDSVSININTQSNILVNVLENDEYISDVAIGLLDQPKHGTTQIPFTNPKSISYTPEAGFEGVDSATYKVYYLVDPTLESIGTMYFWVSDGTGVSNMEIGNFILYPMPAKDKVYLKWNSENQKEKQILVSDMSGKQVIHQLVKANVNYTEIETCYLDPGQYVLSVMFNEEVITKKLIIK